jgi:hypothetical protein
MKGPNPKPNATILANRTIGVPTHMYIPPHS